MAHSSFAALPVGSGESARVGGSRILQAIGLENTYFAQEWLVIPAIVFFVISVILVIWSYWQRSTSLFNKAVGITLKLTAIAAILFCLLEPKRVETRVKPGENLFVILADNSKSLLIADKDESKSRGEHLTEQLEEEARWQRDLEKHFDVRRFTFDERVRSVNSFEMGFDGKRTAILSSLGDVAGRLAHRPIAGILLMTDGNSGDSSALQLDDLDLPPVYPVMFGSGNPTKDLRISRVYVSQSNFEASPVTVQAEFNGLGHEGEKAVLSVVDVLGNEVESQTVLLATQADANRVRFQIQPTSQGVTFYDVAIQTEEDYRRGNNDQTESEEATLANNRMTTVVDRGGGPFRVLYVCGRPNWEYKFLRRAIQDDPEVQLVGLLRIAKREPKFAFRSRSGEDTNPLFRGFDKTDEETEQYDQPVLLRIDTEDEKELRDGFPKTAEPLFRYHAIILDDVDRSYFSHEQMLLIKRFVNDRGGGLLMLGGLESFSEGEFENTPIADLLPVYLNRPGLGEAGMLYRWQMSRDGWLQPWVRLRKTEADERERLAEMPEFLTYNQVGRVKPGAEEVAHVVDRDGERFPALSVQSYGKGRTAALMVGDLWRWDMRRPDADESDLQTSWRQLVRWLVADVPQRVEVEVEEASDRADGRVKIRVLVRDELFEPLDNAQVEMTLLDPAGQSFVVTAEPSDTAPGVYEAVFASRLEGAYKVSVSATAPDGTLVGERDAGWTAEPDFVEFGRLAPDQAYLEQIAEHTGGELLAPADLAELVRELPNRPAPRMETVEHPMWHRMSLFLIAVGLLAAEWGWRRWRGLP